MSSASDDPDAVGTPARGPDIVCWARQTAVRELASLTGRLRHVRAVAACAAELAPAVPAADRPVLVAAAWVHDIGYAPTLAVLGFHPVDGARFVHRQGYERLARLVAHHSGAFFEAQERDLLDELTVFPAESGAVADALTCADMTTGPQGQRCSFDGRISEILHRYDPMHPVHRAVRRSRPVLGAAVERTLSRLRGVTP